MKKSILKFALLLCAFVLVGCKKEDPTTQDIAFEKLSGQWGIENNGGIILDGVDVSLNYAGFSLSFTNGEYTTTNAGTLFSASGTWEWADANSSTANRINLDDGKEVTILELTETLFRFSFVKTNGNSVAGISGTYQISVGK